jgi:hypothetical protein
MNLMLLTCKTSHVLIAAMTAAMALHGSTACWSRWHQNLIFKLS